MVCNYPFPTDYCAKRNSVCCYRKSAGNYNPNLVWLNKILNRVSVCTRGAICWAPYKLSGICTPKTTNLSLDITILGNNIHAYRNFNMNILIPLSTYRVEISPFSRIAINILNGTVLGQKCTVQFLRMKGSNNGDGRALIKQLNVTRSILSF